MLIVGGGDWPGFSLLPWKGEVREVGPGPGSSDSLHQDQRCVAQRNSGSAEQIPKSETLSEAGLKEVAEEWWNLRIPEKWYRAGRWKQGIIDSIQFSAAPSEQTGPSENPQRERTPREILPSDARGRWQIRIHQVLHGWETEDQVTSCIQKEKAESCGKLSRLVYKELLEQIIQPKPECGQRSLLNWAQARSQKEEHVTLVTAYQRGQAPTR